MISIILLIDKLTAEKSHVSNNWVVYNDNVTETVTKFFDRRKDVMEEMLDESINEKLTKILDNCFNTETIDDTKFLTDNGIEIKTIDDENLCIPNKSSSYMFIFNENGKDVDFRVIEHDIAGYAIRLILEEMDFEYIKWNGNEYSCGEDIGYSMTDRADSKNQEATIHYGWKNDVKLFCYRIFQ